MRIKEKNNEMCEVRNRILFGLSSHKKIKKLFCTFEDRTNLEKK